MVRKLCCEEFEEQYPIGTKINNWEVISKPFLKILKSSKKTCQITCRCLCGRELDIILHRMKIFTKMCHQCSVSTPRKEKNKFIYDDNLDAYVTNFPNNIKLIVDKEDIDFIRKYRWYINKSKHTYYARTYINKNVYNLHELFPIEDGFIWDHINSNGLDNRRNNLRKATNIQNLYNRIKSKTRKCTSRFIGVGWLSTKKMWKARLIFNKKYMINNLFKTEIEAAIARDKCAISYQKEFAKLNFPKEILDQDKALNEITKEIEEWLQKQQEA